MLFARSCKILLVAAILAMPFVAPSFCRAGQAGAGADGTAAGDAGWTRDIGDRVAKILTRLNRGVNPTEAAALQRDLLAIGPDAVPPLADALRNPRHHLQVRWNIAMVLGKLGDPRATDALLEVARPHPVEEKAEPKWMYLRACAALSLGRLRAGRASKTLLETLFDRRESSFVRRCAALALGRIGDARALEALAKVGFDRNEDRLVRAAAFLGLAISKKDAAADRAAEFLFGRRLPDDAAAGGVPGARDGGAGAPGREAAEGAHIPAGAAIPTREGAAGEDPAGGLGEARWESGAIGGGGQSAASDDAARPTCTEGGGTVVELRAPDPDGDPVGEAPMPDVRPPSGAAGGTNKPSDPARPEARGMGGRTGGKGAAADGREGAKEPAPAAEGGKAGGKEPPEAAEGDRLIDEMAALAICGRADRTFAQLAVRLFDHGRAQVRIAAAIALGGAFRDAGDCARTAPEIQELKRRAHNDPSALVRVACCVSLYAVGEKDDARRSLVKWLGDPRSHPTVAAYAALALGEMPHEETYKALAGALAHKSELVRLNAVLALGHMPRRENVDLLIRHGAAETDMATRGEIALALMNHDPEPRIGAFLRGYLRDARSMVRSRAAIAMERYDDPDTTKELLALLRDREDDVRAQAALSLAARKIPVGRAELEKLLRTEESEFVKWCARAAIERMFNGKTLPGLFDKLVERRRTLHCSPADEMERLYTQAYAAVLRLDSRDAAEKSKGRASGAVDLDRRDGAKLTDSPQAPPEPPTPEAIRKRIGDPPKEPAPPDPPPSVESFLDRESYDRAVRDLGSCWASHPGPEKIDDAPSVEREWLKNYIQQYRDAYRRYMDDVRRYSVERKAYEKAVAEYREKMMEYERKEAETKADMEAAWKEWEKRVQAGIRYQEELGRFHRQGEKFLGDIDRILDRYSRPALGGGLLSSDDLRRMQDSNRFLFGQYGLPSLAPGDERGSAKLLFLASSPVSPEGDLVQWFRRFLYHRDGAETSYDSAIDPRFRW